MRTAASKARRKIARATKGWWWTFGKRTRELTGLPPKEPLGRIIYEFSRARPGAFLIQIGAHDASQLDPVRDSILTKGWRGILVEPIPAVFERLRENYRDVEGLSFENVAIAPRDGTMDIYYIPQTADERLPPWYDALASFSRDVLVSHAPYIPDIEERISTMTVPTMTFEALCAKHQVREVDFIQIDTEGYDAEIVKLIDLERYKPAILQFEELHMDVETLHACLEIVGRSGYEAIGNGMDCLCLNPERLRPDDERVLRIWERQRRRDASYVRL